METKTTIWTRLFLLSLLCLVLAGCKKSPEELYNEQRSGVVLILNKYYYELAVSNGAVIYFTGLDDNGDLENATFDEEEIQKHSAILMGTGFFIDKDGTILTNRHVAQPQIDEAVVKQKYQRLIDGVEQVLNAQYEQNNEQINQLKQQMEACISYDWNTGQYYYSDQATYESCSEQIEEIQTSQQQLAASYRQLESNRYGLTYKINCKSTIGLAFDNTSVSDIDDFMRNGCVVAKVSDDEDTDLATLRLKTNKTPENSFVFTLNEDKKGDSKEDIGSVSIQQPVYMIGYNAGTLMAVTKKGISAQMTSGKITQNPDGDRVMYDIAAIQGSSGSPVIDEDGKVVAVNFAKFAGSDNFNFGIPINKINKFLDK
jgi:hypothetical protein